MAKAPKRKDLADILNTLIAEAGGQGKEAMRDVAETILNRSGQRGLTPGQVVRQRAQYTGYSSPGPAAVKAQSNPSVRSAAQAAWELAQGPEDPTGGANFYYNPDIVTPSWAKSMTPTVTRNGHAFFTDRPVAPRSPQVIPEQQTNDMRLMRNPAMGGTRPQSPTDQMVISSTNTPQLGSQALQDALARRVGIVAPSPASEEDRAYARMNAQIRQDQQAQRNAIPNSTIERGAARSIIPPSDLYGYGGPTQPRATTTLENNGRIPAGLIRPGNLDIDRRKVYSGPDGSYRTENSISIGTDIGETIIPTVVNGKQLSQEDAIRHFEQTGENLGTFRTPQAADRYAEALHQRQEQFYAPKGPSPAGIDEMMLARTGVGGSRLSHPGLPQVQPETTTWDGFYSGMPASRFAVGSTPQSQIERGTPRSIVPNIPSSGIERGQARGIVADIPQSPIERIQARSIVANIPQSQIERDVPRVPDRLPQGQGLFFADEPNARFNEAALAANSVGLSNAVDPVTRMRVTIPPTQPVSAYGAPQPLSASARPAPQSVVPTAAIDTVSGVPMGGGDPNLGPVKTWYGATNAQPPDYNIAASSPVPAARVTRPSSILPGINLPGIAGMLQDFSRNMNNASGSFNNGLDNLVQQQFRGGNQYAPGAATAVGSNGYMYQKTPTGYRNVGPVSTSITPAQRYDQSSNYRTNSTAADRFRENQNNSGSRYSSLG